MFAEGKSVFRSRRLEPPETWNNPSIGKLMDIALSARSQVNKLVPGNTWEMAATVKTNSDEFGKLKIFQPEEVSTDSQLTELLQVSEVRLISDESASELLVEVLPSKGKFCERCRRYTSSEEGRPCQRCERVLQTLRAAVR
ncbi:hypothetical protein PR048_027497 [Dryococelus australis]|uniref:Uncharacterized protein n=1 Tax=Dryococelus australis TaxID=614101 RepID=A0ABQ9GGP4_9NEOP|nr:hypothetical protein PR048_027497 [Dryococelus australis]